MKKENQIEDWEKEYPYLCDTCIEAMDIERFIIRKPKEKEQKCFAPGKIKGTWHNGETITIYFTIKHN